MSFEQNSSNFSKKAILSKREVVYCIDELLSRCKQDQYDIPLYDDGKKTLQKQLQRFRRAVLESAAVGNLTKPYTSYCIDTFRDRIQLWLAFWDENAVFDESGEGQEGDYTFKPLLSIKIPYIPFLEWCKKNNVEPDTAQTWIRQNRMSVVGEGSNLQISAIQISPMICMPARCILCGLISFQNCPRKSWRNIQPCAAKFGASHSRHAIPQMLKRGKH